MSFPEEQPRTGSIYMPGAQAPRQFGHPSTWAEGQPAPPVPVQLDPPQAAPTQGGQSHNLRLIIVAVLGTLVLLAAGVGVYFIAFAPITVKGTVTLTAGGAGYGNGDCHGTGPYSDLVEGATVTVYDASGKTIAMGQLGRGAVVNKSDCLFAFSVEAPRSDFYGVEIGHRDVVKVSRAEAESGLNLAIGPR